MLHEQWQLPIISSEMQEMNGVLCKYRARQDMNVTNKHINKWKTAEVADETLIINKSISTSFRFSN